MIEINVNLKLNKILSLIPSFAQFLSKQMDRVFGQFISAEERSSENPILSK